MSDSTHMIRLELDSRRLYEMADRPAFSRHGAADPGYLIHCSLRETFGESAPGPFSVQSYKSSKIEVLGYSAEPAERLEYEARSRCESASTPAVHLVRLASKRMPEKYPEGLRLSFQVRLCPVLRRSKGEKGGRGPELDVYLAKALDAGPDAGLDRRAVYEEWFRSLMKRKGARVEAVRLKAFRLARLLRRDRDRKSRPLDRPDATFEGFLTVTDEDLFHEAVRRGIGRHRAFGFGMLLLRPVC